MYYDKREHEKLLNKTSTKKTYRGFSFTLKNNNWEIVDTRTHTIITSCIHVEACMKHVDGLIVKRLNMHTADRQNEQRKEKFLQKASNKAIKDSLEHKMKALKKRIKDIG